MKTRTFLRQNDGKRKIASILFFATAALSLIYLIISSAGDGCSTWVWVSSIVNVLIGAAFGVVCLQFAKNEIKYLAYVCLAQIVWSVTDFIWLIVIYIINYGFGIYYLVSVIINILIEPVMLAIPMILIVLVIRKFSKGMLTAVKVLAIIILLEALLGIGIIAIDANYASEYLSILNFFGRIAFNIAYVLLATCLTSNENTQRRSSKDYLDDDWDNQATTYATQDNYFAQRDDTPYQSMNRGSNSGQRGFYGEDGDFLRNPKSIGACIGLTIVTFGIFGLIWMYRTMKRIRILNREDTNVGGQLALCIFIPFYVLFWLAKDSKKLYNGANKVGIRLQEHTTGNVVLAVFGLTLISLCIMQSDLITVATNLQSGGGNTYGGTKQTHYDEDLPTF